MTFRLTDSFLHSAFIFFNKRDQTLKFLYGNPLPTCPFWFIYLVLAAPGHCYCREGFLWLWRVGVTLRCGAWASQCGDFSCCRAEALGSQASIAVVHGLSCSSACGIFPDQGLNPSPMHWQVSSYPLYHQGSSPPSFPAFSFTITDTFFRVYIQSSFKVSIFLCQAVSYLF